MRRRDALRILPLSIAGITGMLNNTFSHGKISQPLFNGTSEPLSIRYMKKVREMLVDIRQNQSENILEASYGIARTVMNKGTCWYKWDMGHSFDFDLVPGRNGVPEIFTIGFDTEKAKDGDLFLAGRRSAYKVLKEKDILVIGSPSPWSMDGIGPERMEIESAKQRLRPYSDIWIEMNITKLGAVMRVPGITVPFGPVSGIIGIITFWMMMADTCRILARDGKSVPVRGDEQELSGKNISWVNLDNPLMDDYFDKVMKQIEMIGAEMGNVRQIANMAVDSVLAGGRVLGYSRYEVALSREAQQRRGGLALTRGIYEKDGIIIDYSGKQFKGSSKDLVIMGIFQPENEIDLKHYETFRKYGMKVASIGPMTRDIKIPEGRTLPKETDVHVGRMCDTYGIYAVPGFERKVCPTSGAVMLQTYWMICMEIMEEIIRRTGNVPVVYLNGAVEGGMEHLYRMNEIYKERGY